jgi:hypothetical protein
MVVEQARADSVLSPDIQSAAADNSNQFSRANVVGMFVTLQLCQLTQPYGSLLFREASGFFWRCNPLASLVEALIIIWHLIGASVRTWKEGKVAQRSWKNGWKAGWKELQGAASGLLLLRGAVGDEEVRGLITRLMTGAFDDGDDENDVATTTTTTTTGRAWPGHDGQNRPPVSRQPTLEAIRQPQHTNTASTSDSQSERPQILREAWGSNALAHKERRIGIITGLTEFFIFLKLITVTGIGWFTGAGMFLIVGWSVVQFLLFLLHLREMEETEMVAAVRITRRLNAQLKSQDFGWAILFFALHLPFFGYAAYFVSFRPWFPENATGFIGFLKIVAGIGSMLLSGSVVLFEFIFGIGGFFFCLFVVDGFNKILVLTILIPTVVWSMTSTMSYYMSHAPVSDRDGPDANFTSFYPPHTAMYYIVDQSFSYGLNTVLFLCFVGCMMAAYMTLFFAPERPEIDQMRVSAGNVLFTLVVFGIYLFYYDATDTSKPWWTDLFG